MFSSSLGREGEKCYYLLNIKVVSFCRVQNISLYLGEVEICYLSRFCKNSHQIIIGRVEFNAQLLFEESTDDHFKVVNKLFAKRCHI